MRIAIESIVPLRAEASHRSEQTSQLLLFEPMEVLSVREEWLQVRSRADGYTGWVPAHMTDTLASDSKREWPEAFQQLAVVLAPHTRLARKTVGYEHTQMVYAGTCLPLPIANEGMLATTNSVFTWQPETFFPPIVPTELHTHCKQFLGAPYLWGGRTVAGIDCSGYAQVVFRFMGVPLPRDASQQAKATNTWEVDFAERQEGDLAFFHNRKGRITHVGILLSPESIIHASNRVRIDLLSEEGIQNVDIHHCSHHLHSIRRAQLPKAN